MLTYFTWITRKRNVKEAIRLIWRLHYREELGSFPSFCFTILVCDFHSQDSLMAQYGCWSSSYHAHNPGGKEKEAGKVLNCIGNIKEVRKNTPRADISLGTHSYEDWKTYLFLETLSSPKNSESITKEGEDDIS